MNVWFVRTHVISHHRKIELICILYSRFIMTLRLWRFFSIAAILFFNNLLPALYSATWYMSCFRRDLTSLGKNSITPPPSVFEIPEDVFFLRNLGLSVVYKCFFFLTLFSTTFCGDFDHFFLFSFVVFLLGAAVTLIDDEALLFRCDALVAFEFFAFFSRRLGERR